MDNDKVITNIVSNNKMYRCTNCRKESSEFEWNAATTSQYGDDIEPIQEAIQSIEKGITSPYWYTCPHCFLDEEAYLIHQNS